MEAITFHSSPDHQPISPYKSQIKNTTSTPKRGTNRPPFISRQTSNFTPVLNLQNTGLFQPYPPPPYHYLSKSYPPFSLQQQQPPLLPLPISNSSTASVKPNITAHPPRARGLSCPPTSRKTSKNGTSVKTRDFSLAPKKSKNILKKEEKSKPLGPDPKDLPKNVPKVLNLLSVNSSIITNDVSSSDDAMKDQVDEFSGSVAFSTISPPPSSLPLPTFSLRPKLSCNAQAAGVDAGATDSLRRLLRLP